MAFLHVKVTLLSLYARCNNNSILLINLLKSDWIYHCTASHAGPRFKPSRM